MHVFISHYTCCISTLQLSDSNINIEDLSDIECALSSSQPIYVVPCDLGSTVHTFVDFLAKRKNVKVSSVNTNNLCDQYK